MIILSSLLACKADDKDLSAPEDDITTSLTTDVPTVVYQSVNLSPFVLQDIVSGKITAYRSIKVKSQLSGFLDYFPWRNGQMITIYYNFHLTLTKYIQ